MSYFRRVRSDGARRSSRHTLAAKRAKSNTCAHSGCLKPLQAYGRFCSTHGRFRTRHGAASSSDLLSDEQIERLKDHLSPLVRPRLMGVPPQSFCNLLNSDGPVSPVSKDEFQELSKRITRAGAAAHLRQHLVTSGRVTPLEYVTTAFAARAAYAFLRSNHQLGLETNGWTSADQELAWQTVAGRHLLRRQTLQDREVAAGVCRQLSKDLDNVGWFGLPQSEESLVQLVSPDLLG